jgi:DNA-directed RNA polymerase subunit H (RpoH/RPB5)
MATISGTWKTTLYEMLSDRKYDVSTLTEDDVYDTLTQTTEFFCHDPQHNCITVVYLSSDQSSNVGKNDIISILEDKMKPNNSHRCLIILDKVKLTPAAKNDIQIYFPTYIFEAFDVENLVFNITKCNNVPKHKIMTEEEAKLFLKKHEITPKEMPKILYDDAMARYLGMLPGQLCKITRISENGGKVYFYRVCVLG